MSPMMSIVLVTILAACRVVDEPVAEADSAPPNVLLVIADDMHYGDCGPHGSQQVRTSNLDRLAREGLRFDSAFTSTAMCAPTRQQLYTGIFPVRNGAYPNHSRVYEGTRSLVHHLEALGYRVGLAGKSHVKPRGSFPFEKVGKGGLDFEAIEEFITRDAEQPYCLVVASKQPHTPWNEGDASAYPPASIEVPPYLVDTPETREALSHYYAEVTHLDGQVGRCLDLVEESGSADRTLFVFTSEQGSALPFGGKWTCYDDGLRTVFLVRWPGRVRAGSHTDALIQYVDFVPTIVEAAGGEVPEGLDGQSFLAVLEGEADEHRDRVYGVHTTRGIKRGSECYPIRSIRSRRFKYIWNLAHESAFTNLCTHSEGNLGAIFASWRAAGESDPASAARARAYQHRPAEELYDVLADPHELRNLAADPAYRDIMDGLRAELLEWMEQQGDDGIPTEMKALERQGK